MFTDTKQKISISNSWLEDINNTNGMKSLSTEITRVQREAVRETKWNVYHVPT